MVNHTNSCSNHGSFWCNSQLLFVGSNTVSSCLSPGLGRGVAPGWSRQMGRCLDQWTFGYGSKFEAYRTTSVSICLVLTIWWLGHLILTHAHLKELCWTLQALDKLCAVRMKQSGPWICDRFDQTSWSDLTRLTRPVRPVNLLQKRVFLAFWQDMICSL